MGVASLHLHALLAIGQTGMYLSGNKWR